LASRKAKERRAVVTVIAIAVVTPPQRGLHYTELRHKKKTTNKFAGFRFASIIQSNRIESNRIESKSNRRHWVALRCVAFRDSSTTCYSRTDLTDHGNPASKK